MKGLEERQRLVQAWLATHEEKITSETKNYQSLAGRIASAKVEELAIEGRVAAGRRTLSALHDDIELAKQNLNASILASPKLDTICLELVQNGFEPAVEIARDITAATDKIQQNQFAVLMTLIFM